jgi:hypothetical protein
VEAFAAFTCLREQEGIREQRPHHSNHVGGAVGEHARSLARHSAGRPAIFGFAIAAACAEHFAGVKHEREVDAPLPAHQCGVRSRLPGTRTA